MDVNLADVMKMTPQQMVFTGGALFTMGLLSTVSVQPHEYAVVTECVGLAIMMTGGLAHACHKVDIASDSKLLIEKLAAVDDYLRCAGEVVRMFPEFFDAMAPLAQSHCKIIVNTVPDQFRTEKYRRLAKARIEVRVEAFLCTIEMRRIVQSS